MLATCLTLCAIALQPGTVVSIPSNTRLLEAGCFNWVLQDRLHIVPDGTRAIVVRMAPEQLFGVVEIKVFDRSNRLYWLEDSNLTSLLPSVDRREISTTSSTGQSRITRNYRLESEERARRRRAPQPNFAQVDAAIASMMHAAMRDQASRPTSGMPTPAMSVFTMPVFQMEVFSMPVFQVEIFSMPVFHMPVFHMPVF